MSEVTVENINVAEVFGTEDAMERVEKVKAALTADPEVGALVKAAQTVEDVFEIVKKFAKVTLDQTKVLFKKIVDYFKENKAELSDETLENVVGGSFSDWWNKKKADIIGGIVFAACLVGGVVIGACVGGPAGAVVGAAAGFVIGATAGGVAAIGVTIADMVTKK